MSTISERQRQVKQEAAQEAIYEAALDLMGRADFEGLKMQDIAREVGIATGTLYNYFKNKEDLLYYVDRRLHDSLGESVEEIARRSVSARQRFKDLIRSIFEAVEKYHVVFDLAERSGVPDRIPIEDKQRLLGHGVGCFEKVVADGIEEGCFRFVDAKRTATVIFQSIIGTCEIQKYIKDYNYKPAQRNLLEMFEDYLQPL